MAFGEVWDLLFEWFFKFIGFAENVVEALTLPVGDFIYDTMPNPIISSFVQIMDILGVLDAEMSLITYILSTGVYTFIAVAIVKFFASLI